MTDRITDIPAPALAGEDDMGQYSREIGEYPLLSPEEEYALAKRCAQGDEEAIRQMVNANLRLVVAMSRKYVGRGVPRLDLIQEGNIGLLRAARKFDYTLNYRFSTYAQHWIKQGMQSLVENVPLIRPSSEQNQKIKRVERIRAQLLQENGTMPTEEALAEACDMTEAEVCELLQMRWDTCSLDAHLGEEDDSLVSVVEDVDAPRPYESLVREELNRTIEALLQKLNENQREILRLHYGLTEDHQSYSHAEIGNRLGISKQRVQQIEQQAVKKLQKMGVGVGLEDFWE